MPNRRDAVDELLDALADHHADALLEHAAARNPALAAWIEVFGGTAGTAKRKLVRVGAKHLYIESAEPFDRAAGLLAYLVSVAADLRDGDTAASSMPSETLQDWLYAAGVAVDGVLGELLQTAANGMSGDIS